MEGLPNIRVVEVGGGGCGVGAGGIQAYLVPRTQQQCLGARTQGEGLYFSAPLTRPGKAHALAYLMEGPLEWQASKEVAEILNHKSVLISEKYINNMGAGPVEAVGVGPRHSQQHLPITAGHPTSTWRIEIVDVEARVAHNSRYFLELCQHTIMFFRICDPP